MENNPFQENNSVEEIDSQHVFIQILAWFNRGCHSTVMYYSSDSDSCTNVMFCNEHGSPLTKLKYSHLLSLK